ncbi:hypothetical protein ACQCVE_08455 [Metabacillus sp. 113a]|uniref:hypothetical protein n=1 Tax=Metabacillus sp. 113a TaxID=3404706 RepID=UPI003CF0ED06
MKFNKSIPLFISLSIIAGCGMDGKQVQGNNSTPKPAALKDRFTKGYLTSNKVKEGYYEFKSKTNGYTMLFPKDAVISDNFGNEKHGNKYESILYGAKIDGAAIDTQVTYENNTSTQKIEPNLSLLSSSIGYKGTYNEENKAGATRYFAEETIDIRNAVSYSYLSFIKADHTNQAVRIVYTVTCQKDDRNCLSKKDTFQLEAVNVMDSISFTQE